MSYWNGERRVSFPPQAIPSYPQWLLLDCGCCLGLKWGGDSPEECEDCDGSGHLAVHKESGVTAAYPGGPFTGRLTQDELRKAMAS